MRTIIRYEAKDIQTDNKVHTALMAGISLAILEMRGVSNETVMEAMKSVIANFLNLMSDMEIDLVDREKVPDVFRAGFATDADV